MSFGTSLTVAERLALSLDGLARSVAGRVVTRLMSAAMILLVWRRVKRVEQRICWMLERFRAGTLRVSVGGRSGGGGRRAAPVGRRLPLGFGWLLPLVPSEAACFAGQIREVLAEPEMVALIAAAPQARRVLRPLCRMLGIEAEVLRPAVVGGLDVGEVGGRSVGLPAGVPWVSLRSPTLRFSPTRPSDVLLE